METIRKIRLAARDKKSMRQIARDLRLSRNTVRKVLRSGETRFEYHRETGAPPAAGSLRWDLGGVTGSRGDVAGEAAAHDVVSV